MLTYRKHAGILVLETTKRYTEVHLCKAILRVLDAIYKITRVTIIDEAGKLRHIYFTGNWAAERLVNGGYWYWEQIHKGMWRNDDTCEYGIQL